MERPCICNGTNDNCRWCGGTGYTAGSVPGQYETLDQVLERISALPPHQPVAIPKIEKPDTDYRPQVVSPPSPSTPAPGLRRNKWFLIFIRALGAVLFLRFLQMIGCF
jgi:hypothetical protein